MVRAHAHVKPELPGFLRRALQMWNVCNRRFPDLQRVKALGFDTRARLVDQIKPPVPTIPEPRVPFILGQRLNLPQEQRVAGNQLFDEYRIHLCQ